MTALRVPKQSSELNININIYIKYINENIFFSTGIIRGGNNFLGKKITLSINVFLFQVRVIIFSV